MEKKRIYLKASTIFIKSNVIFRSDGKGGMEMSNLEEIKAHQLKYKFTETKDILWLIEQAEKYRRLRDKMLEQTIQKNHEVLKKLADK
jgi:hypothetical protein